MFTRLFALRTARRLGERVASRIMGPGIVPGRPTVLCLDRALFSKDLDELRKSGRLNWLTVNSTKLKHAQERWVLPGYRQQTFFHQMFKRDLSPKTREILLTF